MPAMPLARSASSAESTMRARVSSACLGAVRRDTRGTFSGAGIGGERDLEVAPVHEVLQRPGAIGARERPQPLADGRLVEVRDGAARLVGGGVSGRHRGGGRAGCSV